MQFWPPDDEHMCSKHVEAWNKLTVKQKFCASSWLITEIKHTEMHGQQNVKICLPLIYDHNSFRTDIFVYYPWTPLTIKAHFKHHNFFVKFPCLSIHFFYHTYFPGAGSSLLNGQSLQIWATCEHFLTWSGCVQLLDCVTSWMLSNKLINWYLCDRQALIFHCVLKMKIHLCLVTLRTCYSELV